jgi:hypothetical protein
MVRLRQAVAPVGAQIADGFHDAVRVFVELKARSEPAAHHSHAHFAVGRRRRDERGTKNISPGHPLILSKSRGCREGGIQNEWTYFTVKSGAFLSFS